MDRSNFIAVDYSFAFPGRMHIGTGAFLYDREESLGLVADCVFKVGLNMLVTVRTLGIGSTNGITLTRIWLDAPIWSVSGRF
jgi:hypothetical protein